MLNGLSAPSIAGGSTGELGVYTSSTSIGGDANANISNGALTLGQAGSVQGSLTLSGGTSGSSTIAFPATTTGTITFPTGTTNFTSTGGTSQVLQQTSEGEAITVGQFAASNLSNGTTGTGAVVLAAAPTITGNPTFTGSPTIDGSNVITLANIVKEPNGYSLLGNPNSTASNYSSFQIGSLTQKVSPTSLDLLLIADEANSGALKYSTIGEVIGSTVTGVTSVNSETGAITITDNGGISLVSSGSNIGLSSAGGLLNKLRNGTFDIWQRGTSGTVSTSNSYSADGWITLATGANGTWAQAANNRTNANTLYGLQLTGASSVTDILVQQRIESYLAVGLAGRNVTFQAWIYNNTGGSITPKLSTQYAGSQDVWTSPSNDLSATNLQACTNAAWTQVAYTLAVSSSANNGYEFVIDFGNNFSTTGKDVIIAEASVRVTSAVSTGLNSTPPPAELRFVQSELALCQRYFVTSYGNNVAPGAATTVGLVPVSGAATGEGLVSVYPILFPVQLRAAPGSISFWDGAGNSGDWSTTTAGGGTSFSNGVGAGSVFNISRKGFNAAKGGNNQFCPLLSQRGALIEFRNYPQQCRRYN